MNNLKQLETREVNVGENIFYIRPLPAFKAANMTGELAALVLPLVSGLAPLLSAVDTEKGGQWSARHQGGGCSSRDCGGFLFARWR